MKSFLKKYPPAAWPILFVAFIGLILMLVWPALSANAMGSLPERPPVVLPEDPEEGEEGALAGAHIELQIDAAQNGLWTVVQWQDSAGDWQTVEGWRGALETGGRKVWWVSPAHFNTGPYRWAVYQEAGGVLLTASAPFNLPHEAGEMMQISVSLSQ